MTKFKTENKLFANLFNFTLAGLFIVSGVIAFANTADDAKTTDETNSQTKSAKEEPEKPKVIGSLDEAKKVEEVNAYFIAKRGELLKSLVETKEPEARSKLVNSFNKLTLAVAEKSIELADTDAIRSRYARQKIAALRSLAERDKENGSEYQAALDAYLKELSQNEKYAQIVKDDEYQTFLRQERSAVHSEPSVEKFNKFVSNLKNWSNSKQETKPLVEAVSVANRPNYKKLDSDLANKTVKELIAFVKSDESKLAEKQKEEVLTQLNGFARRQVGNDPEIYGKTFDDKDFSWGSLRGKYVVVQFTASWCGPCKRELPGLKEAYQKYHDKGLEIVSIYVWDKLDNVKKFVESEELSWVIISEELSKQANLPEQGKTFAIEGVPTIFITDKEGKVISTEARGANLQTKLAEIFDKEESDKSTTTSNQNNSSTIDISKK
jgi:thiol-disulfide isomerase/thioredoxin